MKFVLAFSVILAAVGSVALAQEPPKAPWGLESQNPAPIAVPADIRRAVGPDLEYDEVESIRGVAVDLNGDGRRDYLLQSATSLCGNGGCVYLLCDGATRRRIGQFFGSLLVVQAERAHGYPNIATYSHQSAGAASYADYAFDGKAYAARSTRIVEGAALDSLVETLRRLPIWRPRP